MEQNEKKQEVPAWVKIIQDFPEPCQQSIGNLCASVIQNLSTIALISAHLYDMLIVEVDSQFKFQENGRVDYDKDI